MDGKRFYILIVFLLLGKFVSGQSYTYAYIDPCTGISTSVTIQQPSGSVLMFYAGQYQVFTAAELSSGGYEAWVASINAAAPPGSNPCAGNAGAVAGSTTASVGTNVVNTVSNVSGALSALGGGAIGGGNLTTSSGGMDAGGSSGSSSSSNSNDSNDEGNNDNGSSSSGSTDSGSSSSSSGSSNDGSTGSNDSGSSSSSSGSDSGSSSGSTDGGGSSGGSGGSTSGGSGSSGGGSSSGSSNQNTSEGEVGTSGAPPEGEGESNSGGAVGDQTIESSSGGQSDSESSGGSKKNGPRARKGSLIASGDIVAIRNGSDYKATGNDNFKINTGMTYANTTQTFAAGGLLNYTTGINEFALTGYGSYKNQYSMLVGSNSFLYNHKQQTWFNTGNVMYALKGSKYHTVLLGTNFSFGKLGVEGFSNWSATAGVFTTFNDFKGITMNLMGIGMYSPYTFFYEGQWFQGGFLFVPLTSFDFSITNTFKFNISTSTVYLQGEGILNFQLTTGTKMLL